MKKEFHIGDKVTVCNKKAVIVHQMGKTTNDPNEEKWFIVEFDDNTTEDCRESEIFPRNSLF